MKRRVANKSRSGKSDGKQAAGRFKKTVFANGLTLVTERRPDMRSLSMGIWVKVGTRHERRAEAGMSHFLEHMLFKGTPTRSALDIARQMDRVGGEFNAFTSREHTCFHILLLERDARMGLELLTDILLHSDFDSTELERERKVILQEISMVEESPEELAFDLFFEKIYPQHGLGRAILGSRSSIRRFKRTDILKFFREYYRPEQVVFSVAGDVSHSEVARAISPLTRRHWPGRKPKASSALKEALRAKAPKPVSGFWWGVRPTEQVHLVWGVEGPAYAASDRFAAFLLNVYLGGGMSSSLFQEIREKNGLAYTVYSSLSPFQDSGVFAIYAGTGVAQVPLCLSLIEQCVERVKRELLTAEELQMIQENLKGSILLASDDIESRMSSIARNEISFGRYVSVEEVCAAIDAVTPEDIRRVARKIFKSNARSILALGPRPSTALRRKLKPTMIS